MHALFHAGSHLVNGPSQNRRTTDQDMGMQKTPETPSNYEGYSPSRNCLG